MSDEANMFTDGVVEAEMRDALAGMAADASARSSMEEVLSGLSALRAMITDMVESTVNAEYSGKRYSVDGLHFDDKSLVTITPFTTHHIKVALLARVSSVIPEASDKSYSTSALIDPELATAVPATVFSDAA